jgi:hypothetical protein
VQLKGASPSLRLQRQGLHDCESGLGEPPAGGRGPSSGHQQHQHHKAGLSYPLGASAVASLIAFGAKRLPSLTRLCKPGSKLAQLKLPRLSGWGVNANSQALAFNVQNAPSPCLIHGRGPGATLGCSRRETAKLQSTLFPLRPESGRQREDGLFRRWVSGRGGSTEDTARDSRSWQWPWADARAVWAGLNLFVKRDRRSGVGRDPGDPSSAHSGCVRALWRPLEPRAGAPPRNMESQRSPCLRAHCWPSQDPCRNLGRLSGSLYGD